MRKILLLIFIAFCSIIIYQMILGQNGILESYRLDEEQKILLHTKELLTEYKEELEDYSNFLKKNKDAFKLLALQLGYSSSHLSLIKIIQNYKTKPYLNSENIFIKKLKSDISSIQRKKMQQVEKKLEKYKIIFNIIFYTFFGGFAVLVILGIHKNQNK